MMKLVRSAAVILGGLLLGGAGTALAAPAPVTRPAGQQNRTQDLDDQIVPNLSVSAGTTLGQFVTRLAGDWKDVQILQISGPWQDVPMPSLHLRNVSRYQAMSLLVDLFPQLTIHSLGGNPSFGDQYSGRVLMFQSGLGQAAPSARVQAFGLAEMVHRLALQKEHDAAAQNAKPADRNKGNASRVKEAMNDILSLIQATLDEYKGSKVTPSVKLHEPTEVVLVTGTDEQLNAVSQTLKALDSSLK